MLISRLLLLMIIISSLVLNSITPFVLQSLHSDANRSRVNNVRGRCSYRSNSRSGDGHLLAGRTVSGANEISYGLNERTRSNTGDGKYGDDGSDPTSTA